MSESRWEIGSGCNLILTIEGEIEGGATPADTAPETEAVRAAIKTAIAAACPISFTYGRGSMPGAKRTVQPLAFLDRDLFVQACHSRDEVLFFKVIHIVTFCGYWLCVFCIGLRDNRSKDPV